MQSGSVLERTKKYERRIVELRRDFHMHPELSNEEIRTSQIVAGVLKDLGLKVKRNVAGTGVVGLLECKGSGKTVALRADMDALPIQDKKEVAYASKLKGKMHACGHDAHTAMLLGAAMILTEMRNDLRGNIKFIFQPAEETTGGAKRMIEEGVMEKPHVDAVFGLHVSPELETGTVGVRYGIANACSENVRIKIYGESAHGARPDQGIDAITISAQVICALQQIISRGIAPVEPAVLTIGTIKGGSQANIIAGCVEMSGTIRTTEDIVRYGIKKDIEKITAGICNGMGGKCQVGFEMGYPLLINDRAMTDLVEDAALKISGIKVIKLKEPRLGVEDFAFFLQRAPGTFWRLGTGNRDKGINCIAHNPYFDIDEDALLMGALIHTQTVLEFLK